MSRSPPREGERETKNELYNAAAQDHKDRLVA